MAHFLKDLSYAYSIKVNTRNIENTSCHIHLWVSQVHHYRVHKVLTIRCCLLIVTTTTYVGMKR